MTLTLTEFMKVYQDKINETLEKYIQEMSAPEELKQSMEYSLLAGGKRIRPIFLLAVIDALSAQTEKGLCAASALEMVHTYSLIHDDLPAMDDDDYRRGIKTNHKVFGDALAILAGDALLTHAFYMVAHPHACDLPAHIQVKMVRELALYAGGQGMVGGQVADLLGEGKELSYEELAYIHQHKTGDLLTCSVRLGCFIGEANEHQLGHLTNYARHIGLAFQIQDDILDEVGDEQKLGKSVGSDRKKQKTTYVSILGMEQAKTELDKHVQLAKNELHAAGVKEQLLLELADFMVKREH